LRNQTKIQAQYLLLTADENPKKIQYEALIVGGRNDFFINKNKNTTCM
jgi:hypothetical protein